MLMEYQGEENNLRSIHLIRGIGFDPRCQTKNIVVVQRRLHGELEFRRHSASPKISFAPPPINTEPELWPNTPCLRESVCERKIVFRSLHEKKNKKSIEPETVQQVTNQSAKYIIVKNVLRGMLNQNLWRPFHLILAEDAWHGMSVKGGYWHLFFWAVLFGRMRCVCVCVGPLCESLSRTL